MSAVALKVIGGAIALIGAWAAIIAYAGPEFGYPMPPGSDQPAWEWSASHTWRHLLPGVAAIAAGALLWAMSSRGGRIAGAALGFLAGAWMILSPFVVRAWLEGGGGGGGGDPSLAMQILTPLGYHHVPGILTVGLSAFALGALLTRRREPEWREREPERVERVEQEGVVVNGVPSARRTTTTR